MSQVLIVDDDRKLAEALRLRLTHAGHVAEVANSGTDAMRRFDDFGPNVVLLDASMPDMSGLEVCQQIRARDQHRRVGVIFVSGASSPSPDYVRRCAAVSGGDRFITKPFDWREVVDLVDAMTCRRENHEEAPDPDRG